MIQHAHTSIDLPDQRADLCDQSRGCSKLARCINAMLNPGHACSQCGRERARHAGSHRLGRRCRVGREHLRQGLLEHFVFITQVPAA